MKNSATLSPKYQVSIPKAVRESLNWKAGQKLVFLPKGDGVLVLPEPELEDLLGLTKGANTDLYRDRNDRY